MDDLIAAEGKQTDCESEVAGGCLGPNSEYVKLISSDGCTFIVKREYALMSGTIKNMLQGPGKFSETECNEINFKDIHSQILYTICMYFIYKHCYDNNSISIPFDVPPFDINPDISVALMMAANFLDC